MRELLPNESIAEQKKNIDDGLNVFLHRLSIKVIATVRMENKTQQKMYYVDEVIMTMARNGFFPVATTKNTLCLSELKCTLGLLKYPSVNTTHMNSEENYFQIITFLLEHNSCISTAKELVKR